MDASEAIMGLGSHAGQDLLKLSGLDEASSNMVGPEFTYFGVFLSALAYKQVNGSSLNAGAASLASLKSLHSQAGKTDAELLDLVAGLSLEAYDQAITTWPRTGERETVAATLCDVLARLLKSSANIDLPLLPKAKLRAKVVDLFEILEMAHREIRNADQSNETKSSNTAAPKYTKQNSIDQIRIAKSDLFKKFDEGDITTKEYHQGMNELNQRELAIQLEMAKRIYATSNLWDKKFAIVVVIAFVLGFLIGPWLYPKLFGYSNAEECVLNAKHKYAVSACYDLYPSIQK